MHATASWHPPTHTDYDTLKGREVVSADGETMGSIAQVLHPHLTMPDARGHHFFLLDPDPRQECMHGLDKAYLPETALSSVDPERVVLDLTAEQVKQRSEDYPREPVEMNSFRRV
jgi:hypothetical protein